MTGSSVLVLVEDYIAMRRSLGYRLGGQATYLRNFARYLDAAGHHGPIPLMASVDWATSTSTPDPRNHARRLSVVRGFLRHLSALDGSTEVPPLGLLGPTCHRTPPHIYSDDEITALLRAAAGLAPPGGLRPHCYVTLFSVLACTGLRISEALALSCEDVDLVDGVLFRTERSERLSCSAGSNTFKRIRRQRGWTAQGRTRAPRIHDLRHRMVVRRIQAWHAEGSDVNG